MDGTQSVETVINQEPQNEINITLKNGEIINLPFIVADNLRLYHGSRFTGIQAFNDAEETTIGNGFYATSDLRTAGAYSVIRSEDKTKRFVYEVGVDGLRLLDLSREESIISFGKFFKEKLLDLEEKIRIQNSKDAWLIKGVINRNVDEINLAISGERKPHLKWFTQNIGDLVRSSLQEIGFDGLVAYEGGETGNGETTGRHDSYVIFDPLKAKVINEVPVQD